MGRPFASRRVRRSICTVLCTLVGAGIVPHFRGDSAVNAPAPLSRWTLVAEFRYAGPLPIDFSRVLLRKSGRLPQLAREGLPAVAPRRPLEPSGRCRPSLGKRPEIPSIHSRFD